MASYREYWRELTPYQRRILKLRQKFFLKNNGFLTKPQKQRLLKLKKKQRETPDSDFWWNIKRAGKGAIFDLELISMIGDESQLEEIFQPLRKDDYIKRDKGIFERTDLKHLIETIFSSHKPEKSHRDDWRFKLAFEMIEIGIGYFRNMPAFKSNLHQRAFQDVLDSIPGYTDGTESGFSR